MAVTRKKSDTVVVIVVISASGTFTYFFITAPYEAFDEGSIMACPFHPPPSPGRPWLTSSDEETDVETDTESLATSVPLSEVESAAMSGAESYTSVEGALAVEPPELSPFVVYEDSPGLEARFVPAPRPPLHPASSMSPLHPASSMPTLAALLMADENDVAVPPTHVGRRIGDFEVSASLTPPSATSTPFPDTTTPTLRVKVKKRRKLTFRHGEQRVCVTYEYREGMAKVEW